MMTNDSDSRPPEIIGYAEPWIVSPGETVAIKVSCTESEYKHRTVRLIQGIDIEHSPKTAEEEIRAIPSGKRPGRFQTAKPGSFGYIANWSFPAPSDALHLSFYMQPWLLNCPREQTLVSTVNMVENSGFSIILDEKNSLTVCIGNGKEIQALTTNLVPTKKAWSKVKVSIAARLVYVSLVHKPFKAEPVPLPAVFDAQLAADPVLCNKSGLFIAAQPCPEAGLGKNSRPHAINIYNGRLDSLKLKAHGKSSHALTKLDFSLDMSSDRIVDVSGCGLHGTLINAPTRAVKGCKWDGSESDWTRVKYGYGAIHFHEDDLDDAEWATDFTITIPSTARSGAYAVKVEAVNGKDKDDITFFVRPSRLESDNSRKICFVFSTFTYLAYANERLYDKTRENTANLGPGFDITKARKSFEFYKMQRRSDLGLSLYDRHTDGSGVCYSSSKRPILNIRPGYIMWGFSRPREFSADLMMIGFLERQGIPYETITDHDLHMRGVSTISGFNTVITGCHPEYPTLQSFTAYTSYAKRGGNLMYLGGNGFYWVSALDSARPHRLEVRRGDVGVSSYKLPGGEHVNSLDGQRGGLWRSRGMSCNTLFGIGFCAQGTGLGVSFRRTEISRKNDFSWMFTNVSDDIFGENGFGGGASGDEIDRYDVDNGSPPGAVVLATSTGHGDDFGIAIEDLGFPAVNTLGTQTNLVRSDIVYYVGAGGGAVFSVGSINWYCSMGWDDYDNDVARLTGNVIKGFLIGKR